MQTVDTLTTEIRTFYSLKEIRETIESQTNLYKMLLEDYSQWLGSLLRNPESMKDQDKAKKIADLQKVLKTGGRKNAKREDKNVVAPTEWIQFKDLMVCADYVGEAEVLFEVIEELKIKIEKLEKAKNSIIDLERYGMGKDLLFITYIRDGIPEKIVFKPKKGISALEKFAFEADFSVVGQTS